MPGHSTTAPLSDLPRPSEVVSFDGLPYVAFRDGLRPRYGVVWVQIATAYAATAALLLGCVWLQDRGHSAWWVVPAGALMVGYALAYLHLFIHEAAHANLAPDRRVNDLLANAFIGSLVGMDIRSYRRIHFDHHRYLGTPQDTERSYFDALNFRFLAESLTGLRALRVMRQRQGALHRHSDRVDPGRRPLVLWGGILLHMTLVGAVLAAGFWQAAAAWLAGMGVAFPFFAALRQVLEHRREDADPQQDFGCTNHGAFARMFGDGPVASTFGGAGFNRHLLHHWDPQLSYTRLPDAEAFLMRTPYADFVCSRRTTYAAAFRALFTS